MTEPSNIDELTQSKPLRERLMPQASIRFFLVLIAVSALIMVVFRNAAADDARWVRVPALLIATAGACFACYAVLFLIANLFSGRFASSAVANPTSDRGTR